MRQAALLARPSPLPPAPSRAGARTGPLVQGKSGLGGGGSMIAPPIADAGRPLDPVTRGSMETGFGRDFGHVRVHDDARAHNDARGLNARAYAAGNHLVFGEGQYRPQTAVGQALIAHELAHTVQQSGVQMKADGPLPAGADAELEGQADRAAEAVTAGRSVPTLSRIGAPAVFRADNDAPAPLPATAPAPATAPVPAANTPVAAETPPGQATQGATNVPDWVVGFENDGNPSDLAPAYLGVRRGPVFKMPTEKGANDSVQQAYARGGAVSTIYTTGDMSSYKEGLSSDGYQKQWLNKYGYTGWPELSKAILGSTDPDVVKKLDEPAGPNTKGFATNREFVIKLAEGIRAAGCAVDHIVEKHMGGASVPANLQLFDDKRNSASGGQSWIKVKELIAELRAPTMRGAKATQIQIFYSSVEVAPGPVDPSFVVETLVSTKIKGSDKVVKAAEGVPVNLLSGPNAASSNIKDHGKTEKIDFDAERVVQGMRLMSYTRSGAGPTGKLDDAIGEFDNKAMKKLKPGDATVKIKAEKVATPAASAAPAAGGGAVDPARETRRFQILAGPQKIPFEYPNLSPGHVTSLKIDDKGELTGSGVIHPRVKFLGDLHFSFGKDMMKLSMPLDPKRLKSPISGFRFTGGSFDLELAPKLVPSGTVNFEIGPANKPIIVGDVTAKSGAGGGFAAEGNIKPGPGIPGAESATGKLGYDSQKGWYGRLDVSSNAITNTVIKAAVILQQKGDKLDVEAEGGAKITVKDKTFDLNAKWVDGSITYSGKGRWEKPFRIVDAIEAKVYYRNNYLKVTGGGSFNFRAWKGTIDITYERFAGGGVKVTGDGHVEVETKDKKGKGSLDAHIDETGKIWGKGKITYQITPTIKPELEVELDKENHLHITGSLTLGPYTLFERLPKDGNDMHTLFTVKTPKFTIPTPIMGVTVYARLSASVGYGYYVGPALVESIKITGSFDPLEENTNVQASLVGKFKCPVGITGSGTIGAYIGADVLGGLAELEGGVSVTASISAQAIARAEADGKYADGNFTVGIKPALDLSVDAGLGIKGEVTASAAWGLVSHTWDFAIASYKWNIYKKTIDFGDLSTTFGSGKAMPGTEKIALPDRDPMDVVMDVINRRKNKETPNPNYDPNARPPAGHAA